MHRPSSISFFLLLLLLLVYLLAAHTFATTDTSDLAVLEDLLKGVTNPEKLPNWTGDDPCGSSWSYVQCSGSSVTQLQLKGAGLRGQLPSSINKLSSIQQIALQGNIFSGRLPTFNGLSQLTVAYLGDQQFDTIPGDFFKGLTSLTVLTLQNNPLNSSSGWSLPSDIATASGLNSLTLTNTTLAGPIPDFLGNLSSLQELRLAYNQLTGSIPASFANLGQLTRLELNNQGLPGTLSGPIDVVGNMPSLKTLWLQVNSFSGAIPAGLGSAVTLQECRLNDNKLVGLVPSTFSDSSSLQFFSVKNNKLMGPIPDIPSITNASAYDFSGNNFCVSKPGIACDAQVTALLSFLNLVNYPTRLVDSWTGNNACSSWQGISCNAQGKNVIAMNLPKSQLSGTISPALANLTSLAKIVLSDNNLTGTIPDSLTALASLVLLDVSDNNIYGPVPKFDTGRVDVVLTGNANINNSLPASSPSSSPSSGNAAGSSKARGSSSLPAGAIAGVVAGLSAVFLFAAIVAFAILKRRRRLQRVRSPNNTAYMRPAEGGNDADTVKITVHSNTAVNGGAMQQNSSAPTNDNAQHVLEVGNLVISIELLRKVTGNFSERNVLGKGGFGVVYKGELDDGTKIAVKRMLATVVSNKGLDEFQAEIAVLTKVRHRHLVALLGYCIEGNERLLVYEYMPLGTLSQHLFEWKKLELPPLSWERRLSIALDVARGVEYLHGLAHKSFIHRDLKPSNILLGDDYRAKVSDFGLVKLAPEGKLSVETRLAGTFGYLAPEYAVTGRVTTKADVFSFGVVLMELLTGRKALDETQAEANMHLVTWFRRLIGNKEAVYKAVDTCVEVNDMSRQGILIVAELAGHCTAREPHNRPDMGHAVNVLSPLVDTWQPSGDVEDDDEEEATAGGIDLHMTLPQALKRWQGQGGSSIASDYADAGSSVACPPGLVHTFTSSDGR